MSSGAEAVLENAGVSVYRLVTGETWKENCYFALDRVTSEMAIIDPGAQADRIMETIAQLNGRAKYLLLTHAHHDHVGAAAELSDALKLPAIVHPRDRKLLRMAPTYAYVFAGHRQRAVECVENLSMSARLELGSTRIQVLETPGHSPGGVCYWAGPCIFTGDSLLWRSIGRTDLPGSDRVELGKSVDAVCSSVRYDALVCPGHGDAFPLAAFAEWWREVGGAAPEYTEPARIGRSLAASRDRDGQ